MNTFSSIIGHKTQIESLENDIANDKTAHAYLFVGPSNIGKSSVAIKFAEQYLGDYKFHDFLKLEDNGESLKIAEVRDLIERANMTSYSGKRFVLIENVHRISIEGANALLKTLEEPGEGHIFVLTIENIKDLPDTIASRCRIVKFSVVEDALIKEAFNDLDEDFLKMVNGRAGLAFSITEDQEKRTYFSELINLARNVSSETGVSSRFQVAEELSKDLKRANDFLDVLLRIYRQEFLNSEKKKDFAKKIEEILRARELIQKNVNIRLLLENLFLCI